MTRTPTSRQIAVACAKACDEKKTEEIVILDVRKLTFICDFFVVGTTMSERQSRAIAEDVRVGMKRKGLRLIGSNGLKEGRWAVLDFGVVVVHLFYGDLREFYDLESLWAEAPRITWKAKTRKTRRPTGK